MSTEIFLTEPIWIYQQKAKRRITDGYPLSSVLYAAVPGIRLQALLSIAGSIKVLIPLMQPVMKRRVYLCPHPTTGISFTDQKPIVSLRRECCHEQTIDFGG
ncbi:hypothetical protein [Candidatus Soleaferrea massiliensis]|uniref:hypothetical protein n=1 Tax=Candidatus Soleaferrea massiliensis TaxID=1470354 RepID=UPI000591170E|nr:hypothetical protein [Candidatus Soleaferrea massiliensis]